MTLHPTTTPAPSSVLSGAPLKKKQEGEEFNMLNNAHTCGWFSGVSSKAWVCGSPSVCATNTDNIVACTMDGDPAFYTTCVGAGDNNSGGCGSGDYKTLCCNGGGDGAMNTECGTLIWTGSPTRSMLSCVETVTVIPMLDKPFGRVRSSTSSASNTNTAPSILYSSTTHPSSSSSKTSSSSPSSSIETSRPSSSDPTSNDSSESPTSVTPPSISATKPLVVTSTTFLTLPPHTTAVVDSAVGGGSSGLSDSGKSGIGAGAGAGILLLLGVIALVLFKKRHDRNNIDTHEESMVVPPHDTKSKMGPQPQGQDALLLDAHVGSSMVPVDMHDYVPNIRGIAELEGVTPSR